MLNRDYIFLLLKNHRGLTLFGFLLSASLQFLIIYLIVVLNPAPLVAAFLDKLPLQLRMLFQQEFITSFSLEGAAAFGFNHPLVLTTLGILAIIVPSRHLTGEAENGTLELLLSYPFRRRELLFSLWLSGSLLLLMVVCGGWIGSLSALSIYHQLTLPVFFKLIEIGFNLWLLFTLVMSYTLLASSLGRESGKVATRSAGLTLIFYFLHFLSSMWQSLAFTKPFNIFSYYQPQKLMANQQSFLLNVVVLVGFILFCLSFSFFHFQHRDIPG
ncbi:hypothetical protein B1H10_06300 [candidate division KSB1 bacterium 4484_188]|nr:MAG: hypothetical protein B1H10_06300 [candidate division KSB1 bacterium 4484_188]HFE65272.1 hypothetical protein [Caldithrix sp.]